MNPSIQRILVPTDFSLCAEAAYDRAVNLARAFGAEVICVHVSRTEEAAMAIEPCSWREGGRSLVPSGGGISIDHVTRRTIISPDPVQAILDQARSEDIDLIVIGAHGDRGERLMLSQGVERGFLGRTTEQVVRHATCAVMKVGIMGSHVKDRFHDILLVHGDESAKDNSWHLAGEIASANGARVHLLYIMGSPGLNPERNDSVREFADRIEGAKLRMIREFGLPDDRVFSTLARGNPARVIRATVPSRDIDLVIQESRNARSASLLGTVALDVARSVPCAVLTTRSDHSSHLRD